MEQVEQASVVSHMVILGGEPYQVVDFNRRTVLADHWLQKWLRKSGGDKILPGADEDSTTFIIRLSSVITDSGFAPHLVAGLLLPKDVVSQKNWTWDTGEQVAATIGTLSSAEDHETVSQLALQIAFEFFKLSIERLARAQGYGAMAERSLTGAVNN